MNYLKSLCVITALSVTMYSCKKEDMIYTPATTPSHQDNRMMKEIDKMMNKMDSTDMKGDPDTHFAKMMKVHHQGAIDMSKIIISEGKDPFIRNVADKMIQNQTKEIARLDSFLTNHTSQPEVVSFNKKMEASLIKMRKNAYLQYLNGNLDHDFAALMIYHHQSAIEMADLVIRYGSEKVIADIAQKMRDDQEKEINDLQDWLLK